MIVQFDVNAVFANRQQNIHLGHMGSAIRRIGTGLRINNAADDPAGLGISQHMQAQIRGIDMARRNAQEGISLLQVAEAGASEIASMVQRIREILVQAANDMLTENERRMQQEEVNQLTHGIRQIASFTTFNSIPLLTGMMGHSRPLLPDTSRPIQNFPPTGVSAVDFAMQASSTQSIQTFSTPPTANQIIDLTDLANTNSGAGWNYTDGILRITSNDIFQIDGDALNYLDIRIEVENDAEIILNNVRIDTSRGDAMDISSHDVNLWLVGDNILRTNSNNIHGLPGEIGGAGIAITSGNLVIDGPGNLRAEASQDSTSSAFAGIGSGRAALSAINGFVPNPPFFTGSVTIAGGNVTAIGGDISNGTGGGAGIGGGSNVRIGSGADTPQLNITGGTLYARGGSGAAGIGAGSSAGSGMHVHVTGGTVHAHGGAGLLGAVSTGFGGAGIGTGARSTGNNGGSLTIDGGIVNVHGGARSAAVGGAGAATLGNAGANVIISGGLLEIHRGWIGGSNTTVNQGQTIVAGGNLSIHDANGSVSGTSTPYYYIDRSNVAAIDLDDPTNTPTGEPAYRTQIFLNDTNHVFSQHGEYTFNIGGRTITATADSLGRLFFYLPESSYGAVGGAGHMVVGGIDYTGEFVLGNGNPDHRDNTLILTPDAVPPPPPPPPDNDVFDRPNRPHIVGRPMVFQVGPNSYNLMFQHIGALTLETLGLRDRYGNNTINVIDRGGFAISQMIGFMDDIHSTVMAEVSHLGASQNRLAHIQNQLDVTHQAHSETHDNIVNVDNAREMSRFARHGLLRQASTIMMAQSTQARHDSVRALLNVETLDNNARFGQHPRDREAFDFGNNTILG